MIVPKDDERKKVQKATKPAFGLGNVSAARLSTNITFCFTTKIKINSYPFKTRNKANFKILNPVVN